jgi:hypothetical protein
MNKLFEEVLHECWSETDYDKYLGGDFNPLKGGMDGWGMPGNPDDAHSALWDWFSHSYFPEHKDLSNDDLGTIVANAYAAGWMAKCDSDKRQGKL